MGISTVLAALLVRAREKGATFGDIATIGRQSLSVPPAELQRLALRLGLETIDQERIAGDGYAEAFLTDLLDAASVTSFDYSNYQGVDVTHDFNRSLDQAFHQSFDCVIDAGSMEHIFDVRRVLSNYMSMLRLGGSLFLHVPSNNLMGHGLYQFSPELFYRAFGAENGFSVEEICLTESPLQAVEISAEQRCYLTRDPDSIGKRIRLVNDRPVMLFVHARRTELVPLFQSSPMQSDYSSKWAEHDSQRGAQSADATSNAAREPNAKAPFRYATWWEVLRRGRVQRRKQSFRNRRFFQHFEP